MKRSTIALELVDAGLQFVSSRGQISKPNPGLALVDGVELSVGLDAESVARLKPRRLYSRFWQDLGTGSLGRPFPSYLRTADLAHAHLKATWERDGGDAEEVVVAVPGFYTDDQLSLFLGIARELAIPVSGLVDAAVASAADREVRARCLHLDLQLHRAVVTQLEHGEEIARTSVRVEPRVGVLGLRDLWARVIAQTFVRATRFDPLHLAATEQVLYAQLPDHLEALVDRESTQVRIASGGRQHVIELDRARVVAAAASAYDVLATVVHEHIDPDAATLLLSHRAAMLPGFVQHIERHIDANVITLHQAAAGSGALAHADRIRSPDTSMPFVTRLPGLDARPPGPVTVPVTPPAGDGPHLPTHLVLEGVAHRIESTALSLSSEGIQRSESNEGAPTVRRLAGQAVLDAPGDAGVTLNGEPIDGRTALAPGDRLSLADSDREILVVTMQE